jgi:transcriptional regulator with XRE-family HTH domain
MAITVTADLDGFGHGAGVSRMTPRRGIAKRDARRRRREGAEGPADRVKVPNVEILRASGPVSPLPGVIGAAVVQAARRSAHLTRLRLARQLNVGVATVRSWESGTIPLFAVPYGQLQQLAQALDRAGAQVGTELGDLLLASRCDLLLTGMLHGFEDYAEVPPIEENGAEAENARSLLRWALAGQVPDRYRQHASPRRLLDKKHIDLIAAIAHDLQAESQGADLAGFGGALRALASH